MTPFAALALAAAVAGAPAPPKAPRPAAPPAALAAPAPPAGPVTIYRMQQIATGALPPELLKQLEPLHSLDDIEALLKRNRITFGWREADIRSTEIAPEIRAQVASLPPHEVFVAPEGPGWIISVIVDQHPATDGTVPPKP